MWAFMSLPIYLIAKTEIGPHLGVGVLLHRLDEWLDRRLRVGAEAGELARGQLPVGGLARLELFDELRQLLLIDLVGPHEAGKGEADDGQRQGTHGGHGSHLP